MSAIAVCRVDRKAIPLGQRAAFAALADRVADDLHAEARRAGEDVVVLGTCERFEVYHAIGAEAVPASLDRFVSLLHRPVFDTGIDALRHLFRVATGLESRIVGEPHVLGQVRAAFERVRRIPARRSVVAEAFAAAIRCGRLTRRRTALGSTSSHYAARAIERLREERGPLGGAHVAIVGTGALARESARGLRRAGVGELTIAGRHAARVAALAEELGAQGLGLPASSDVRRRFDAIVAAVSAAEPVITVATLGQWQTGLLLDLGAAPNVDPLVDALPDVRVLRLEDLGRNEGASQAIARADELVELELARYLAAHAPAGRAAHHRTRKAS